MRNIFKYLRYLIRVRTGRPKRYRNLLKTIFEQRSRTIMEIGAYKGRRAGQMIDVAGIFHPSDEITYVGFDLFESLTDDDLEREFSKRPPSIDEVRRGLEGTGARIYLHKGYTKDTLPRFLAQYRDDIGQIDFIFVDGGHSIETIASDWGYAKDLMNDKTILIFDDYYTHSEPEVRDFGCRSLIDHLDRSIYTIGILEPEDSFQKEWGTLNVKMVKVSKKVE